MGRPLLVRSGKGVRPTAYGRAVMEYAVIMRKAAEKIASLAVPEGENSLRLSAYPSRMIPRLTGRVLPGLGRRCPRRISPGRRGGDR